MASSLDGQPHGFASGFGFNDFLLETVNPDAAIEDFAHFAVLAYEDAAFGVFRAVARMDADALPFAVASHGDRHSVTVVGAIGTSFIFYLFYLFQFCAKRIHQREK